MAQNGSSWAAPRRVLVIEESAFFRRWLRSRLGAERLELIEAPDGVRGLESARASSPDLILLDLSLTDCDGFEILRQLKEDGGTCSVPVLVLSASTESADKARALDLGAADCVSKPSDAHELLARIGAALRTRAQQQRLERVAHRDSLTGLANRLALEERLTRECLTGPPRNPLSVWIVDLDHFKRVNDDYGHVAGDEVLRHSAELLRSSVRPSDFVARYGGDEFVVFAPQCELGEAVDLAERFRGRIASHGVVFARDTIRVTVCIGVASVADATWDAALDLLANADQALYEAKYVGANSVRQWHGAAARAGVCVGAGFDVPLVGAPARS